LTPSRGLRGIVYKKSIIIALNLGLRRFVEIIIFELKHQTGTLYTIFDIHVDKRPQLDTGMLNARNFTLL